MERYSFKITRMQTISLHDIIKKTDEHTGYNLLIKILLNIKQHSDYIKYLKSYFTSNTHNTPNNITNTIITYISKNISNNNSSTSLILTKTGVNTVKSIKYKLDKLPVILDFYKLKTGAITSENYQRFLVYKKIYTNKEGNWLIRLIIEKKYMKPPKNKKPVDWDNNDEIYVELEYIKPNSIDIKELKKYLSVFLSKTGGSYNTKNYIVELLNMYIKPIKPFRYISDMFNIPCLLNRTEYFNIINTMDKINYCINTSCSGIHYIIIIDSDKNIVYFATKSYIDESAIVSKCGICVLTAVKSRDMYIIKKVIIDNGIIVTDNTIKQINDRNSKFGEILNTNFTTYSEINLKNYKKQLELYKSKVTGAIDFIEFSQISSNTNTIYQWSPKQLPIIFYCRECPSSYLNNYLESPKNHILYILFLTINIRDLKNSGIQMLPFYKELFGNVNGFFMPVHFSPSTMPNAFLFYSTMSDLDKKFVSLAFNSKLNDWIFVEKVKSSDTDIYGDDFRKTETQVWNSYRNPVTYNDLIIDKEKISDSMYFVALKNKAHEAPIKLNNFVKSSLINKYAMASKSVIDLASGRASDLMNYRLARINELLFIEIDKDAVDIVIDRKYILDNPNKTQLKIFNTNLNDPYKPNLAVINNTFMNYKVPNIFCFFALHYLTTTLSQIQNIAALISNLLENGGSFLYTAFDSMRVINLLDKNSGKWEILEKSVKKYSIISNYKPKDIKTPKRHIKLILPFNTNTYYYDENLINDEILDKEFSKHKLIVEYEGNFLDFLDKFKEKKYMFYNNLTDADKTFVGLYKYKIFKKI